MSQKLFVASSYLISLGIALFLFLLGSASSKPFYQSVEIASGNGFSDIARMLSDKKIIRSQNTFLLYGIISGSAHQLKPGNYFLSSGSTTPEILRVIVKGPAVDKEITFPEGVTLKDIDAMLAAAKILPAGALVNFNKSYEVSLRKIRNYEFLRGISSLEGFLFPDTYRFFPNSKAEAVVKKFLDNFEKKAQPLLSECKTQSEKCKGLDLVKILTIASLLEKEAPEFRDRQIIAGIIYKRLELGIALHIDATITYAKCGGAFLTCAEPKVFRKDLTFQSLYNTYLYNGLPPGPIGNPGSEAIKAALNPIKSEYLYYLSDPKTKKTIFSQTLEEHIENRAKYLGA